MGLHINLGPCSYFRYTWARHPSPPSSRQLAEHNARINSSSSPGEHPCSGRRYSCDVPENLLEAALKLKETNPANEVCQNHRVGSSDTLENCTRRPIYMFYRPGQSQGCSTNTFVISPLTKSKMSSNIFFLFLLLFPNGLR